MTTDQLSFNLAELVEPTYEPEATIQEKFDIWIAANGWVLREVERLIADWLDSGHSKVGMNLVWNVIRWNYGTTTGDKFKANNDWTSRMARLVLARHPEWVGVIETRELRAA